MFMLSYEMGIMLSYEMGMYLLLIPSPFSSFIISFISWYANILTDYDKKQMNYPQLIFSHRN